MNWFGGETLTYRQVIEAVKEAILPLQNDISDLRDKVTSLQTNSVSQQTLEKYVTKEAVELKVTALEGRVKELEDCAKTSAQETTTERRSTLDRTISISMAVIIALGSGLITIFISNIVR